MKKRMAYTGPGKEKSPGWMDEKEDGLHGPREGEVPRMDGEVQMPQMKRN